MDLLNYHLRNQHLHAQFPNVHAGRRVGEIMQMALLHDEYRGGLRIVDPQQGVARQYLPHAQAPARYHPAETRLRQVTSQKPQQPNVAIERVYVDPPATLYHRVPF